jgi:hypothetical protein
LHTIIGRALSSYDVRYCGASQGYECCDLFQASVATDQLCALITYAVFAPLIGRHLPLKDQICCEPAVPSAKLVPAVPKGARSRSGSKIH